MPTMGKRGDINSEMFSEVVIGGEDSDIDQ